MSKAQAMFETILALLGTMLFFYGFMTFFQWAKTEMRERESAYHATTAEDAPDYSYNMRPLKIVD